MPIIGCLSWSTAMPISVDLFREVFRRWPSGVAVVTARHDGPAHGMVVGSFCSLSNDPSLVMVSAGETSRTREIIERGGASATVRGSSAIVRRWRDAWHRDAWHRE